MLNKFKKFVSTNTIKYKYTLNSDKICRMAAQAAHPAEGLLFARGEGRGVLLAGDLLGLAGGQDLVEHRAGGDVQGQEGQGQAGEDFFLCFHGDLHSSS